MMAVRDDVKKGTSTGSTPKERETGVFAKANGEGGDDHANDGDSDDAELELLSLLSRADLQECLAMLANVVAPLNANNESEAARQASVPLAQLDHTVLLELHFPESSIYRHPPGSSFEHQHSYADSGRAHGSRAPGAGSVISSAAGSGSTTSGSTVHSGSSRRSTTIRRAPGAPSTHPILPRNPPSKRALPIYSPQNAYAYDDSAPAPFPAGPYDAATASSRSDLAPPPNQNPAVEPAHRGVGQIADTLFPFLQVVATLQPDTDLVICTAILANMPLPVTVTGSPEKADKAEVRRDKRVARAKVSARRERERESRDESHKAVEAGRRQRRDEPKVRESDQDGGDEPTPPPPQPSPSPAKSTVGLPPAPAPAPSSSSSTAGRDPPARLMLSLPPQPSFGSPSPFPDGYKPSRPPLAQRSTSYSSISGASSGGSTVVGRPPGSTSTPENGSPRDRSSERFGEPTPGSSRRRHSSTTTIKATPASAPPSRRASYDRGVSPSSRGESAVPLPAGVGPPSPQPPQHYAEPTYAFGAQPLQTPSVSDELKELWVDNAHRSGRPNELPRGFVQEKESRAAIRRRGGARKDQQQQQRRSDERASSMGESDNDIRDRERRRQSKKRDKEWKREQDERNRGHEGLGDVTEQDEPAEDEDLAERGVGHFARKDDDADGEGDAYDDVLGFDEEDTDEDEDEDKDDQGDDVEGDTDTDEMARLRVRMRTGSTSSDGSAHEREQAHAEAHRAQAQQEAEQRHRDLDAEKRALSSVKSRSESGDDHRSLIDHEEPRLERRNRRDVELDERLLQEELERPEDESRLVLESPASGIADADADAASSTGSSSDAESTYGLGLADGPSSMSFDEGVDGQGNALVRIYNDPFLDTVAQTACGRTILGVDWSATSLGDIRSWNGELRSHVMAILASPFHTALWMGADNVLIYNDAYARLLGPSKHPAVLGKSGAEGWSELWDVLGPLASQVFSGRTLSFSDHCNCIMRNGMLEETCASLSLPPLLVDFG